MTRYVFNVKLIDEYLEKRKKTKKQFCDIVGMSMSTLNKFYKQNLNIRTSIL